MKGNLRLSGYSACGQDGGVQLPREYVDGNSFMQSILSNDECHISNCLEMRPLIIKKYRFFRGSC